MGGARPGGVQGVQPLLGATVEPLVAVAALVDDPGEQLGIAHPLQRGQPQLLVRVPQRDLGQRRFRADPLQGGQPEFRFGGVLEQKLHQAGIRVLAQPFEPLGQRWAVPDRAGQQGAQAIPGGGAHAVVGIGAGDALQEVEIDQPFQRGPADGRVEILPGELAQRRVGFIQFPQGALAGRGIGVLPLGLEEAAQDHGGQSGFG